MTELTFEEVDPAEFTTWLFRILKQRGLEDFYAADDLDHLESICFESEVCMLKRFEKSGGGVFDFKFYSIAINNLIAQNVKIDLYKYSGTYDVNILFRNSIKVIPLKELMNWTANVAQVLKSTTYYCGIEPARDRDTRYFTENMPGPLKW